MTMAGEWQDISTAPKDGTPVDLWIVSDEHGSDVDLVSFYCNGLDRFNAKTRRREGRVTGMVWGRRGPNTGWYPHGGLPGMAMTVEPTHWMPLPTPPHPEQGDA